jgi:hypothetical protein
MTVQHCVICAWRENCAKRFSIADGGARCPDFSRDVSIKVQPADCALKCIGKELEK